MTDRAPGAAPLPPDSDATAPRPEPESRLPASGSLPRPMPSAAAWLVSLVLAAVVGALLFSAGYLVRGGSAGGTGSCNAPSQAFAALCEAYDKLKTEYVDSLDDAKLAAGAIQGMFQYGVADPFSGYMPPEDYQQALGDLSGKFSGIGAEMAIKNLDEPANLAACTELSDNCVARGGGADRGLAGRGGRPARGRPRHPRSTARASTAARCRTRSRRCAGRPVRR